MNRNDHNILEVSKLSICFDINDRLFWAVNEVSFNVQRGRTLALVGESGCGKTVTALSLLKLINPPGRISGGRIRFFPNNGKSIEISALDEKDPGLYDLRGGQISMIFQEPMTALSPVHTIGSQISEALTLHKTINAKAAMPQVLEILGKVGIPNPPKVYKQYPHEISGGMRQRAVIAMALIAGPELLIADEPTTALDVTIQAQILDLMKKIQEEMKLSILLITHDLGVVSQVAADVAVMYLGGIVESAPVRQLIKNPSHPYTMALLRSIPGLNTKNRRLTSIEGSVPSLSEIPEGCPFHPRCRFSQKGRCDIGSPPVLRSVNPEQYTACLRAEEIHNNG